MFKIIQKILFFGQKHKKSLTVICVVLDSLLIVCFLHYFYDMSPLLEDIQAGYSISSSDAISIWGFGLLTLPFFTSFHNLCCFLVSLIPKKKNNRISSEKSD